MSLQKSKCHTPFGAHMDSLNAVKKKFTFYETQNIIACVYFSSYASTVHAVFVCCICIFFQHITKKSAAKIPKSGLKRNMVNRKKGECPMYHVSEFGNCSMAYSNTILEKVLKGSARLWTQTWNTAFHLHNQILQILLYTTLFENFQCKIWEHLKMYTKYKKFTQALLGPILPNFTKGE